MRLTALAILSLTLTACTTTRLVTQFDTRICPPEPVPVTCPVVSPLTRPVTLRQLILHTTEAKAALAQCQAANTAWAEAWAGCAPQN